MSPAIMDDDEVIIEDVTPNKIVKSATSDTPEIDTKSLESLMPRKMLNDRVIEFYMNHLLIRADYKLMKRIHLFSTFFYCKLKQIYRTRGCTSNQSIKRWDKNVKLFEKDFLVLPICDAAHWLLIIVCYPSKVSITDDEILVTYSKMSRQKEPCLLIFDSLHFKYMTKFTDSIRNFLATRWQYERPDEPQPHFSDRHLFKEYCAKVPKQRNLYDCGIYLLNSFENFIRSVDETVAMVREGKDLSKDWEVDTLHKRIYLKELVSGT